MESDFKVCSLEKIDKLEADRDMGVVRVSGAFLKKHSHRNALLKISALTPQGKRTGSIVRIVRAATTGPGPLRENEIALQYDDRLELSSVSKR